MSVVRAETGLTVVVPCCNEESVIRATYAEICAALADIDDLEILMIDDGSTDGTLAAMRSLAAADPRARYLSFSRNFGLAAAAAAGFDYASKPWIAQVDADLQNPPAEIWKLLAKAGEGYDVVFGVRQRRQDPLVRRWGSSVHQWLARRGLGIEIPAGASSFRVLRTGVARTLAQLRLGGPYFVATVPMVGARYARVPTAHRRRQGRSRFRLARLVGHSFELFFGYSWRPLNTVYLLAAVGVVAAPALAGLAAAAVLSPAGAAAAALLLSAGTLAAVALVGRYVHRLMLDQKPTRPYYVRAANIAVRPEDRLDAGLTAAEPPAPRRSAGGSLADGSPGRKGSAQRIGEDGRRPERAATGSGDGGDGGQGDDPPLLILGAGEDQLPVYREAKRRGLRTIAVDRLTDRPALSYADERLHLSTRYPDPIAAALGARRLAGVVSAASDACLASWCELAERYHAPYRPPRAAALLSMDKAAFHAVSEAAGVPSYRWRKHHDRGALARLAGEIGFPLIAKPVDGSGSKGVTLVSAAAQLTAALDYAAQFAVSGEVLIEEFLEGRNLTVDVFLRGGRAGFIGITEKRILPGPHFVVGGHTCPAPIDEDVRERLGEIAVRLCRAVGLLDGPANFDVILGADGVLRVLEANMRLCGNSVPSLMREVYGVDTVAALVSLATGEAFDLVPRTGRTGIVHVIGSPLPVDGVLGEVTGLDAVRAMPGVAGCEVHGEPGSTVHPFTEGGHKLGYLMVSGADVATAEQTLTAALEVLDIPVRPARRQPAVAVPPPARQPAGEPDAGPVT